MKVSQKLVHLECRVTYIRSAEILHEKWQEVFRLLKKNVAFSRVKSYLVWNFATVFLTCISCLLTQWKVSIVWRAARRFPDIDQIWTG